MADNVDLPHLKLCGIDGTPIIRSRHLKLPEERVDHDHMQCQSARGVSGKLKLVTDRRHDRQHLEVRPHELSTNTGSSLHSNRINLAAVDRNSKFSLTLLTSENTDDAKMMRAFSPSDAALVVIDAGRYETAQREVAQGISRHRAYSLHQVRRQLGLFVSLKMLSTPTNVKVLVALTACADLEEARVSALASGVEEYLRTCLPEAMRYALDIVAIIPCDTESGLGIEEGFPGGSPSLIEAFSLFPEPERLFDNPFRAIVMHVFNPKPEIVIVSVSVLSGQISTGEAITFFGRAEKKVVAVVEEIRIDNVSLQDALAGDLATFRVTGCSRAELEDGQGISSSRSLSVGQFAQDLTVDVTIPFQREYPLRQTEGMTAIIANSNIGTSGGTYHFPRQGNGDSATVEKFQIQLARPALVEPFEHCPPLGVIALYSEGYIRGFGKVTSIVPYTKDFIVSKSADKE